MAAHVEGVGGHEPLPLPIKQSESILPAWLGSMHNIPDTSYGLNTLCACACVCFTLYHSARLCMSWWARDTERTQCFIMRRTTEAVKPLKGISALQVEDHHRGNWRASRGSLMCSAPFHLSSRVSPSIPKLCFLTFFFLLLFPLVSGHPY